MGFKNFCLIMLFLLLYFTRVFAQYQVVLKNDTVVTDSLYSFDVFIRSEDQTINLTSYQIILAMNDTLMQDENLGFSYVDGSSELTNIPNVQIGTIKDSGIYNLTIGSNPGSDIVSTEYVRIGKFQISDPNLLNRHKVNLNWDFAGFVKSGVNIDNNNETDSAKYINLLVNPLLTITDIGGINEVLPKEFKLFQNFPNPFNPVTRIKFELPYNSKVTLQVYNIIGQKIRDLLSKELDAGSHSVLFDASNLPSGTYIYRLQAEDFTQARKMILLK